MSVIEYKFEQYKTLGPIIYKKEKYKLQVELLKLQEDVIKNKRRIALCFEGRDTAGKSSTINFFSEHLRPSNFRYIHYKGLSRIIFLLLGKFITRLYISLAIGNSIF